MTDLIFDINGCLDDNLKELRSNLNLINEDFTNILFSQIDTLKSNDSYDAKNNFNKNILISLEAYEAKTAKMEAK